MMEERAILKQAYKAFQEVEKGICVLKSHAETLVATVNKIEADHERRYHELQCAYEPMVPEEIVDHD